MWRSRSSGAIYVACGGQVIGHEAELAYTEWLRFTDEGAVEDSVVLLSISTSINRSFAGDGQDH